MKKIVFAIISILTFSLIITGCSNAQETNTQNTNPEISAVLTHERIEKETSIKIIDVRTQEEYDQQHLSNSILLPLDVLSTEITKRQDIKKDDEIIVYCRSGRRSMEAYNLLNSLGYKNVKSMSGGINSWTGLGYNVCLGESQTC